MHRHRLCMETHMLLSVAWWMKRQWRAIGIIPEETQRERQRSPNIREDIRYYHIFARSSPSSLSCDETGRKEGSRSRLSRDIHIHIRNWMYIIIRTIGCFVIHRDMSTDRNDCPSPLRRILVSLLHPVFQPNAPLASSTKNRFILSQVLSILTILLL